MKSIFKHPTTYLLLAIAFLFTVVIVPFSGYIAAPFAFFLIFGCLLSTSFLSSAIEASYSGKVDEPSTYKGDEENKKSGFALEYTLFSEKETRKQSELSKSIKGVEAGTDEAVALNKKLKSLKRHLEEVQSSMFGKRRSTYMGTFATVSLFLNTALVAFLPLALREAGTDVSALTFRYPIPYGNHCAQGNFLCMAMGEIAATSIVTQKVFLFVAVSTPLLLLGKIIPKHLGATYPSIFSLRLRWLNRPIVFLLGWFPSGAITINDWIVKAISKGLR